MIENLAEFFKAISDPTRLRIVNLLLHKNTLNVNNLVNILDLPQSKVSRHLAVLRNTGWLTFIRRDKWVYYRLNSQLNKEFLNSLEILFKTHLQFEADLIKADEYL